MSDTSGRSSFRFGPFVFDPHSGELRRDADDRGRVARLSPQPSRLLAHLIECRPRVVTHAQIRELLWPDVEVEFEQSLHTAVRQIRAALGDSASEPTYIETIARRGYRFLGSVESETPKTSSRSWARTGVLGLSFLGVLAIVLTLMFLRPQASPVPAPIRIAVMPFEPTTDSGLLAPGNDIAESIVESLTGYGSSALDVVGPTTTEPYDGDAQRIRALIDEWEIDYLINARESRGDRGARLLIEVIRARDGAHVWARYLDDFPPGSDVPATIVHAVAEAIGEGYAWEEYE